MRFRASAALLLSAAAVAGCRPDAPPPKTQPTPPPVAEALPTPTPAPAPAPEAKPEPPAPVLLPEIPWLRDHDKAYAEAKKLGKPVLINFWCGT
ncbi:MAG: hypothetical protein ACYTGX_02220 [Planctomycetota bacterium]|jgi:hypothetical protein